MFKLCKLPPTYPLHLSLQSKDYITFSTFPQHILLRRIFNNYINIYKNMEGTNLNTKSSLSLTNRNILSLSGVKKVRSTEPTQVIAILDTSQIIIAGANLSVQNVNIQTGILELSGQISSIKYTNSSARKFSIKNMFK